MLGTQWAARLHSPSTARSFPIRPTLEPGVEDVTSAKHPASHFGYKPARHGSIAVDSENSLQRTSGRADTCLI